MRIKGLVLLVIALLVAGGTAVMVKSWLNAQRASMVAVSPKVAAPVAETAILVAKTDLAAGQFVRPENLRWQAWPQGSLADSYVVEGQRRLDEFVGGVVRFPIVAGEPVTEGRVVIPSNSGFLAAVLQPGMRAVSVPVNATSGISGFVFPGDRVDLLLAHTLKDDRDGTVEERHASATVLRDLRVLAIDQKIDSKPGEPAVVARTATVEVTPKQSELVVVAMEMGKLALSLRSLARDDAKEEFRLASADAEPTTKSASAAGSGEDQSYTLDSEASPVLPPPTLFQPTSRVVILRGGKTVGKGQDPARDLK